MKNGKLICDSKRCVRLLFGKVINFDHSEQRRYISAVGAESHFLPFTALFRTFCYFPHFVALFTIYRTVLHSLGMKTSKNLDFSTRLEKLGRYGTHQLKVGKIWYSLAESWEDMVLTSRKLRRYGRYSLAEIWGDMMLVKASINA